MTLAGSLTEYDIPSAGSRPAHIVLGADHSLWFTEPGRNQIGKLSWVAGGQVLADDPTQATYASAGLDAVALQDGGVQVQAPLDCG